jgi:hypothetical protein
VGNNCHRAIRQAILDYYHDVLVSLEAKLDFRFLGKTRIELDATLWNECNNQTQRQ